MILGVALFQWSRQPQYDRVRADTLLIKRRSIFMFQNSSNVIGSWFLVVDYDYLQTVGDEILAGLPLATEQENKPGVGRVLAALLHAVLSDI